MLRHRFLKTAFLGVFLTIAPKTFALGNFFYIDIFPTFRMGSQNFVTENMNRFTVVDYFNQNRFLTLSLDFSVKNFDFYIGFDMMQHLSVYADNYPFSNFPYGRDGFNDSVNSMIPTEGYISYKNDLLEFSVGRRRWALGAGDYSLTVGRDMPYFDGIWFGFHPKIGNIGRFYYYFLGASDDQNAVEHYLKWNTDPDPDNPDPARWPYNDYVRGLKEESRWFFVHKVGFSRDTWRIGIAESLVLQGQPLTFWLSNPFFAWHNMYMNTAGNVSLSLSGEKVWDTVRFYAEFIMDDLQLPWENKNSNPLAIGLYGGVDWQLFDEGERFAGPRYDPYARAMTEDNFRFEGGLILSFQTVFASRFLYNRDGIPLGKFTLFTGVQGNRWGVMEHYVGFPYGGDTVLAIAKAQWQNSRWFVDGGFGVLVQGHAGAAATGYYDSTNYLPQGMFTTGVSASEHWAMSGVENVMLVLNPSAYYAINQYFSAYASIDTRLVVNHFSRSHAEFQVGVYGHF
jgi:hypothetical protein